MKPPLSSSRETQPTALHSTPCVNGRFGQTEELTRCFSLSLTDYFCSLTQSVFCCNYRSTTKQNSVIFGTVDKSMCNDIYYQQLRMTLFQQNAFIVRMENLTTTKYIGDYPDLKERR